MSAFANLQAWFDANWTTVLVGWNGLGFLSPWPDRWTEFPPLLSADEISSYAEERLASCSNPTEQKLIVELLSLDLRTESRQTLSALLERLSAFDRGDPAFELKKWRVALLEQVLENLPEEPLYGLMAFTEFWQDFGYPPDSPHEVQGRGNTISPADYYQQENLNRLVVRHRAWIENQKATLKAQAVG